MVFWIGIGAMALVVLAGVVDLAWDQEIFGGTLAISGVVVVAAAVLIGLTQLFTTDLVKTNPDDCRTGLAALTNTTETSGSFGVFLGIGGGSYGDDQKIVYMTEDARGGIALDSLPVKYAVIYEDGEQYMACRIDTTTYDISWAWPFGEPKVTTQNTGIREFHVPEGSVVRDFSVDLNN